MAEGAERATEPRGLCLQRAQRDSRFNGCSEIDPPTSRSHSQKPGLQKHNSTDKLCQCIGVKPCFALVCKCDDLPFVVPGTNRAWQSFALLQQKSHCDHSQAPQVVCWHYSLQQSLGIMKEMKKQKSIYGGTRITLILFLSALSPVSFRSCLYS